MEKQQVIITIAPKPDSENFTIEIDFEPGLMGVETAAFKNSTEVDRRMQGLAVELANAAGQRIQLLGKMHEAEQGE